MRSAGGSGIHLRVRPDRVPRSHSEGLMGAHDEGAAMNSTARIVLICVALTAAQACCIAWGPFLREQIGNGGMLALAGSLIILAIVLPTRAQS